MSNSDEIRAMFFEECNDLMESLFEGLNLLEEGSADSDTVNAVFRAVHSIKGGAGAFKLDELVSFAHKFETVLDELRSERIDSDPPLVQTMLRAADHLAQLIEAAQTNGVSDVERGALLLAELDNYIGAETEEASEFVFQPMALNFGAIEIAPPDSTSIKVRFQPFAKLYQNGHDPLLLIDALRARGDLSVEIDTTALAPIEAYDPNAPSLVFLLEFESEGPEDTVKEVFEFVDGICGLDIFQADNPENGEPSGTSSSFESPELPSIPTPEPTTAEPTSGSNEKVQPSNSKSAAAGETAAPQPTLRVELDKVDRLINTVGELIINQAMISQRIDQLGLPGDSELESDMADYKVLARELQEGVMSIRAQPVKPLFQRMGRITREAGDAIGKSVRLTTVGENTEVDKTVIERLADPLTHMIRNAVDHGLESSETRAARGKPETGEIRLSASHKSGSVMIEVADDGAGLNRDRILDIAMRKGLIPKDVELSDPEIDKLLFLPGFSTNAEVSKLSGRGVGMDVVKTAVQALGGRITITSVAGKGTTFSILLPLTLAVMDGIVISVADETMIIPITAVIETLRPKAAEIHDLGSDQRLLLIRGEYVPIVDIRQKLGLAGDNRQSEQLVLVLVEGVDHNRCALCVDAIHDQRQVVIKGVGGNYGPIPGVSAATILGNGRIALILDTDHLSHAARSVPVPPATPDIELSMMYD